MKNYITEFNQTGVSIVNVPLICKNWDGKFTITTWINDEEEKYTLDINKRGNSGCKTLISKEQALEIINTLQLVHCKSPVFRSAGSYVKKDFIFSQIQEIKEMVREKEMELSILKSNLNAYVKAYVTN